MAHFKQEKGYGCGIYALANLFQKESIITNTRLQESIKGNNLGQLNKWLLEEGYDLFIEPLYYSSVSNRLSEDVCSMKPSGEDIISLPVLISIQATENSKMHFVTADITKDGMLLVVDSLQDDIELTTLSEYQQKFYRVFGLWNLRSYHEEGYFMRFNPEPKIYEQRQNEKLH